MKIKSKLGMGISKRKSSKKNKKAVLNGKRKKKTTARKLRKVSFKKIIQSANSAMIVMNQQ